MDARDDASSLRAALSVIDDFEFDFGFLFDADGAPQELPPAPSARPPRRRATATPLHVTPGPYTGCNRRKLEIQALRQQEAELARQLEQAQRLRVVLEEAEDDDGDGSGSDRADLKSAWEGLAQRQRAQREQAMRSNESLRGVVGFQAKIAQQLLAKTRRALTTSVGLLPQSPIDSPDFDWQSLSIEDHLAEVDRLYTLAPRMFSRPCFSSGRRDFQELKVEEDGDESFVVALDVSMVLPFSVDRVADALWYHTTRMSSHERIYQFKDLVVDPSSMVSLFAAMALGNTPEGCMQGQIATRRYKPKDTKGIEYVISKMVSDVLKMDGHPFLFYGDGFLKCTEIHRGIPSSTEDGTTTSPLTQVHWHRRVQAKGDNTKTGSLAYLSCESIASRMKDNVAWNVQTMENLLMTPHRRKSSGYVVLDCSRRSALPSPVDVTGELKLEPEDAQKTEVVKPSSSRVGACSSSLRGSVM